MTDSFSGKNGKVKVMFVRSDESDDKRQDPTKNRHHSTTQRKKDNRWGDRDSGPKKPTRSSNERPPKSAWQARLQDASEPMGEKAATEKVTTEKARVVVDPAQIRRQRNEESKIYGENACKMLFEKRPDSIVRAYFVESVTPRFRETLRWLAANRRAYHVVDAKEITNVSGTEHHGGICFIIKKRQSTSVQEYLAQAPKSRDCILAIEDIGNPHNLGGIMRSAAHFGVNAIMLHQADMLESGAAVRTAEGGAEFLHAIAAEDLGFALEQMRNAGYTIITTSSHKGTPLSKAELPAKTVFVFGQESDGLSDKTLQKGDISIAIDGTGNVESLNVSVAAGILLAEWWRQHPAK